MSVVALVIAPLLVPDDATKTSKTNDAKPKVETVSEASVEVERLVK